MLKHYNTRNPILPLDMHVPDGEAHVMPDGEIHIYGSFDKRSDVFLQRGVPCRFHCRFGGLGNARDSVGRTWFNNPDAPKYPG